MGKESRPSTQYLQEPGRGSQVGALGPLQEDKLSCVDCLAVSGALLAPG